MIRRHSPSTLASPQARTLRTWVAWTATGLLLCGMFWYFNIGPAAAGAHPSATVIEASVSVQPLSNPVSIDE